MAAGDTGQLLEQARGGSDSALEAFYARAARKLLPLIRLRLGRTLRAELESLPEAQREIIVLRTLEELSFVEIGTRLDKSADACRMAFARAMAALTVRLGGRP